MFSDVNKNKFYSQYSCNFSEKETGSWKRGMYTLWIFLKLFYQWQDQTVPFKHTFAKRYNDFDLLSQTQAGIKMKPFFQ